jgi:predicted RNA-binding protein with PUA-like domain
MAKRYWLMKSSPVNYSIQDLEREGQDHWDGVRNYTARNFMRDDMKLGDLVLFHHSNAKPPGVAGIATVCREGYPDHTAFDRKSQYHDPKSKKDEPRWFMVDLEFAERFEDVVSMDEMRAAKGLEEFPVLQRGQRLSIMPITRKQFEIVRRLGRARRK